MKLALACATLAVMLATIGAIEMRSAATDDDSAKPQYSGEKLVRPEG